MTATPDFDPLARIYRWLEWITFGPCLHRCRIFYLPQMRAARYALVMGDGDGRFTRQLLEANPAIEVHAVDSSREMLDELLKRAGEHAARVRIEQTDARQWKPESERYDLIATHFFLDCFTTAEVAALIARIREATAPGALWVISDFQIPENTFGTFVAFPIVQFLYFGFRILTGLRTKRLPEYEEALSAAGYTRVERKTLLGGLLFAEYRRKSKD
ncbi:MAG: class I SAM-dependent methyltransferase [Acidobacteriota bacterium]|nr:class I SAM-dependent methyltransferase [Acidobacteriota bacterium]